MMMEWRMIKVWTMLRDVQKLNHTETQQFTLKYVWYCLLGCRNPTTWLLGSMCDIVCLDAETQKLDLGNMCDIVFRMQKPNNLAPWKYVWHCLFGCEVWGRLDYLIVWTLLEIFRSRNFDNNYFPQNLRDWTYARIQLGQPGHVITQILLIFVVFIGSASVYAVFLLKIKLTLLSSCCQTRKNTPFLRLSIRLLINRWGA